MALTLIEKILLRASPGKKLADFVYARVKFCFGNDITAPLAVKQFAGAGFRSVFNPARIAFVCDHFVPARDLKAANNVKLLRDFARKFKLRNFFDINNCGIEHAFLLEEGLFAPGDVVVGADSHTCTFGAIGCASFGVGSTDLAAAMHQGKCWFKAPATIKIIYKGRLGKWITGKDLILNTIGKIGVAGALYKVMEFTGPVIRKLGIEGRLTMCNMAVEAAAMTGIIAPDDSTFRYLDKVTRHKFKVTAAMKKLYSDKDAGYDSVVEIDVTNLEPQVACPHLPSNVKPAGAMRGIKLTQVVIGSCTNGRISDLRIAAGFLRNNKVKKGLRVIILPASPAIFKQAQREGLIRVFLESGCLISPPTCGPCLGGHMGILDEGEVALSTTNRNFVGRMGSPKSFVYLSSPAVAAASAIKGRITHPDEI